MIVLILVIVVIVVSVVIVVPVLQGPSLLFDLPHVLLRQPCSHSC